MESYLLLVEAGSKSSEWESEGAGRGGSEDCTCNPHSHTILTFVCNIIPSFIYRILTFVIFFKIRFQNFPENSVLLLSLFTNSHFYPHLWLFFKHTLVMCASVLASSSSSSENIDGVLSCVFPTSEKTSSPSLVTSSRLVPTNLHEIRRQEQANVPPGFYGLYPGKFLGRPQLIAGICLNQ